MITITITITIRTIVGMIIIPPFSAPVFGKPNTSTVCAKHTQVKICSPY